MRLLNLQNTGNKIVVGVSGGADSLCLSLLSHEFAVAHSMEMHAAFVDHRLRSDSLSEIRMTINEVLKPRGISNCHILTWEHDKLDVKGNIEKRARDARYKLLFNFCHKIGAKTLLMAHHKLDQWETFFMRLSRGSGLSGLCSMNEITNHQSGVTIIRPFLGTSPNFIKETLREKFGITKYVVDPMNDDPLFERVAWRKRYETFDKIYGLDADNIEMSIKRLKSAEDCLDTISANAYESVYNEETLYIDKQKFIDLHPEIRMRVIKKIINDKGRIISHSLLERTANDMCLNHFKATNIAGYIFRKDKTKNIMVIRERR